MKPQRKVSSGSASSASTAKSTSSYDSYASSTLSNNKPDIAILRAKLLLAARHVVPRSVLAGAFSTEQFGVNSKLGLEQMAQQPWLQCVDSPTDRDFDAKKEQKERYYILDGDTWTMKQYGTAWEVDLLASYGGRGGMRNTPVEAGNGVVVFVKDSYKYKAFREGFEEEAREIIEEGFDRDKLKEDISPGEVLEREWRRMGRLRKELGLEERDGDGNLLWCYVAGALKRIRRGEV